jgi:hypothetical protein
MVPAGRDGRSGAAAAPGVVLRIGEVERVRIFVARVPYFSIVTMLADSCAGIRRGLPEQWRDRVRASTGLRGLWAISPIGADPRRGWSPDCLTPFTPNTDITVAESLDLLRSTSRGDIQANLVTEFGERPPLAWWPAMKQPKEWVAACSDAIQTVATETAQLWQQALPLVERDTERAGAAMVRGGKAGLLSTLNSRITYTHETTGEDTLRFTHPVAGDYDLNGRDLVLVPMVTGDRMLLSHFDHPDCVWIGYPVPGLGPLWNGQDARPAARSGLAALLGPRLASILLYIDRPATMTAVAQATNCHPNQATANCKRLVDAGLLQRHRHGRRVYVSRSERGEALLHLYDD